MSNYEIQAGTLFETFETIGDWTGAGTGGGAIAVDTSIYSVGSGSLKITAPAAGNYYATKTISADLSRAGIISYDVYVENTTNLPSITVYISSTTGFTSYFSKGITSTPLKQGWNRIRLYKNFWGNTGVDDWANTMLRIRVRVDAHASAAGVVYFDQMRYGTYHRPKIVWTCDDGRVTQYSELFAYMSPRRMRATCYVYAQGIASGANYMTLANLTELYGAGWDICSHTYNHTNLTTLSTQAEMQAEISNNRKYLETNGFTRNSMQNHFCYPNGGFNPTVLLALQAENVLSARTVKSLTGLNTATPVDDPLLLITRNLGASTTLAVAKASVDNAISAGATLVIESHNFVTPAVEETEFPVADMQSLVDYIYQYKMAGILDVVTISEWYRGLSEGRKSAELS
ncbi:hypothetical protein A2125_01480 [Candidatus Woesebacteria bacterium GWB1_43_5]|uniref:NodB homology domain-containing protein n=1 Tax=Candidatus Woesebacteria bacterium GWB1_43_5 TaxID=1802474 RepID=A0A1F7WTC6_9BACT|nr:MAG: hypothetical protein A2125_01480 [Candidatus Woesebacteria bacterium GWB1_43_5]